jgi:hypothetical protein
MAACEAPADVHSAATRTVHEAMAFLREIEARMIVILSPGRSDCGGIAFRNGTLPPGCS